MKLDRNANDDKAGKYALVNLRIVRALPEDARKQAETTINALAKQGIVTFGNESDSQQFMVFKYGDMFAHHAIRAYSDAIIVHCGTKTMSPKEHDSLREYAYDVFAESNIAKRIAATSGKIPD